MRNTYFLAISVLILNFGCSSDSMNNSNQSQEEVLEETAPRTEIRDSAFEQALIELGYDDVVDGTVITANIEQVNSLVLDEKGLSDLTGIEDFKLLENLWINSNTISDLNVSSNMLLKFIFIDNNELTTLTLPSSSILEKVSALNNKLTELNVSNNTGLQVLDLANNSISNIDLSNIPNGIQLNTFSIEENPLDCIKVNESQLENIPNQWTKDAEDDYALMCS